MQPCGAQTSQQMLLAACGLSVLSWVFTVSTIGGENSVGEFSGGFTAGVFKNSDGSKSHKTACGDYNSAVQAVQAFGVMLALFLLPIAALHGLHALNVMGVMNIPLPPPVTQFKFAAHGVTAFFALLCWSILAGMYDSKFCGRALKDNPGASPGYGIFLMLFVMFFEIGAAACSMIGAKAGPGPATVVPAQVAAEEAHKPAPVEEEKPPVVAAVVAEKPAEESLEN